MYPHINNCSFENFTSSLAYIFRSAMAWLKSMMQKNPLFLYLPQLFLTFEALMGTFEEAVSLTNN